MKDTVVKILSYFWDVPIIKTQSSQNEYLEVVWSQGRKMLNTRHANFSFGNGYKVFEKAFAPLMEPIKNARSILVLGFGCGSILDILERKYNYNGELVGVEYDSQIIELFHNHFKPDYQLTPTLVIADAEKYLKDSIDIYDIIIVDLFSELNNTPLIENSSFLSNIKSRLTTGGIVIFNTIKQTEEDHRTLSNLIINLSSSYKSVTSETFQDLNLIITAK